MSQIMKSTIPHIFMMLFGILIIILIPYQVKTYQKIAVLGPDFFPYLLAVIIMLLSLFAIVKGFIDSKLENVQEKKIAEKREEIKLHIGKIILYLFGIIFWIVLVPVLGFVITNIIVSLFLMYIVGNRSIIQLILVPILLTIFLYIVFISFLSVYLPTGIFM